MEWRDLGGNTYVLGSQGVPGVRLNTGLVVGAERAMVVDTGCGPRHGAQILTAVRELTELPLVVATTHAHWDHFFGNAVFRHDGATEFWAHAAAARAMAATGESQRAFVGGTEPEMAAGTGALTEIVPPTALVEDRPVLVDLGGVSVTLFWLGRAHTDGDLLVGTPSTLFAGDIVEEGADPSFEDSFPADWADVLRQLVGLRDRYDFLVPGHGKPASSGFVAGMADTMTHAVRQASDALADMPDLATKAIPMLPYGPDEARLFLSRLRATQH
ncbi:MBL fold metallo-hydrolase [Specibacter cremeus]|uniref:MBL fold metallo-hydrolase n=1 Tax=Specibacter cremeus TaxID=1629051 RepID=UPI000F7A0416|nr:MBL fold metallo-hydrolase [Specibacter cremeus]